MVSGFRPKVGILCLSMLLCAATPAASPARAAGDEPPASCDAAAALSASGRLTAAEAAYAKALEGPATADCATKGLRALDEAHAVCERGATLAKAGRETEARAAYEEALKTKPGARCAADGISSLQSGFLDDPTEASKTVLAWLGLGALAIGGALLVLAILGGLLTRIRRLRRVWPLSVINPVRIGIVPFEDGSDAAKRGAPLAALVRTKMDGFGGERAGMMIDLQAAIEETLWTKFGAINDQAKTVSAMVQLIGLIYPFRQFEAKGLLQSSENSGLGITLSVSRKRELVRVTTLWTETFGVEPAATGQPDASLRRLAGPVAAWITHVTATAAGEKAGGAMDPVSWAMFRAGLEWELEGNLDAAISLYRSALTIDPANWGAHTQLGIFENDEHDYESAIDHLERACKVLEDKDLRTRRPRRNPDWYKVKFRLASTLANDAYANAKSFEPAAKQIDELLQACWWALEPWPWERLSKRNRVLRKFVARVAEPASIDLKALIDLCLNGRRQGDSSHEDLAKVRRRLQREEPVSPRSIVDALIAAKELAAEREPEVRPSPSFLFDIACFFQIAGEAGLARTYARRAWQAVPADKVERFEQRVQADPMLSEIPDVRDDAAVTQAT
jgi:tetratricopeptide (TPR) repeat protein